MGIEKIIIGIVTTGIIIAFAALVFSNIQDSQVENSTVYNTTGKGIDLAVVSFSNILPSIALISIGIILLIMIGWIISLVTKKESMI